MSANNSWDESWEKRLEKNELCEGRDPFGVDAFRIIHSAAFRRLQSKTQMIGARQGSLHQTRLTHSIEVASACSGILSKLRKEYSYSFLPSYDLVFSVGLLHDLGHPPFGHMGETALNCMMLRYGGFEANGQTIRLVTSIENLNLSRRVLLGVLKYPISYSEAKKKYTSQNVCYKNRLVPISGFEPPKCYLDTEKDIVEWLLEPLCSEDKKRYLEKVQKSLANPDLPFPCSLDCSIMDIADDISYTVHDLGDAVNLKMADREMFLSFKRNFFNDHPREAVIIQQVEDSIFRKFNSKTKMIASSLSDVLFHRAESVRALLTEVCFHYFVRNISLLENNHFKDPIFRYTITLSMHAQIFIQFLKKFIYKYVTNSKQNKMIAYGEMQIVMRLFEIINSHREEFLSAPYSSSERGVCDYISSMTDEKAYKMNTKLCGYDASSIFEILDTE